MKREYRKRFCVLLFLCPLLLSGCMKQTSEQDASEEYKEEAIQIGITFDSFIIERWQRDRDGGGGGTRAQPGAPRPHPVALGL